MPRSRLQLVAEPPSGTRREEGGPASGPETTALVAGAGGLGAAAALALAAGGVSRIVVADGTTVSATDLSSQPLLVEADVGAPRAETSTAALSRRFPAVSFRAAGTPDAASARALVSEADVVVHASNRASVAFALNDAAAAAGKPLVHAGVLNWTAQLATVLPGETGCLRCLFEEPPLGAADASAPGPLAALAGALLGAEALRLLGGGRPSYAGTILEYEARSARVRRVPLPRRSGCPACGGPEEAARAGGRS
jgi:adenylyltransferase/sulfurtransferase